MDYYKEIKEKLVDNEIYASVKDYSKERHKLKTYIEIGKLLYSANNKYGNKIIKEYSERLSKDLNKKYSVRYLFDIRKLYLFIKVHPLGAQLTISHCRLLFRLNNSEEIEYYIKQAMIKRLGKRQLELIIKSKEFDRLSVEAKTKLANNEDTNLTDIIPNPIIIRNKNDIDVNSEKALHNLIIDNIESFMNELGSGYSFIGSEYKIKIGSSYNYIDLLLFNIEYNCYVVVELKVTELKKEHIGQISVYMNYIDKNVKKVIHDKTIGIIICKKDNKYVIEYSSDERIIARTYKFN